MRVKVFPPHGCDRSMLDERCWIEVPEGTTVSDLLRRIRCSKLKAKLLLVSVNGVRAPLNTKLRDGDIVGFFSLATGG